MNCNKKKNKKIKTLNEIGQLKLHFECDWLIKLSDNKLSNNNLPSELVENRTCLTNHERGNCNFYD